MTGSVYLIQYGGKAGATAAENTAVHRELIDALAAEAKRIGWGGCTIDSYRQRDGYVSLSIGPGSAALTLDDLRAFSARQATAYGDDGQPSVQKGLL